MCIRDITNTRDASEAQYQTSAFNKIFAEPVAFRGPAPLGASAGTTRLRWSMQPWSPASRNPCHQNQTSAINQIYLRRRRCGRCVENLWVGAQGANPSGPAKTFVEGKHKSLLPQILQGPQAGPRYLQKTFCPGLMACVRVGFSAWSAVVHTGAAAPPELPAQP